MKKNIIIAVLVIANIVSLMYAYIQNGAAKASERRAMEVEQKAIEYARRAEESEMKAMHQVKLAQEAMEQAMKAR